MCGWWLAVIEQESDLSQFAPRRPLIPDQGILLRTLGQLVVRHPDARQDGLLPAFQLLACHLTHADHSVTSLAAGHFQQYQ